MEVLFFILVLLGLAILALSLLGRKGVPGAGETFPYRLKGSVLTPAERSFLGVLERVVPEGVRVWPKVRLVDFLLLEAVGKDRQAALNRVVAKHVDFLLVRAQDARPLLAIELDDQSHLRKDRQERDRFLEALFRQVGLPLVRVRVKEGYSPEELRRLVEAHLRKEEGAK
ncbi:DUF2726 domain-containing protein [Thermus scotoductus]|uniref:DUF2726 domain-containing protein n=3 Tax=Thermus TaxID=270 RepID=A0A0N0ZQ80_THESC|nr:DUF2726 domain-containing protein [Thermus scotoductus]ADW20733.1 topoisomerase DNA binding C4 zinc finger domain protein [Thermus scotoductus SA-01]KPD32640.1 hypothetical protein AN926_01885 [Thermus scotoductus]GBD40609.1 hypothetical protein HRbin38_00472 [bacterium HR38]HAR68686.1 DUF2726 domain-containing protein [Thermus scotoductus]